MADDKAGADGNGSHSEHLQALLAQITSGRDRAATLGLDLIRYFLDMAALELKADIESSAKSAPDTPSS